MGWSLDPGQVIACNDVVAGLTDLLRAITEPGDRVVVTPPVYHPFFSLVPEAGCELAEVPLAGGRELDLDGDRAAPSPAAPGRCCSATRTTRPAPSPAASRARARSPTLAAEHDAWILADEIHAPLTLPGAEHVPFLTVSAEAASRAASRSCSASKTFNLAGLGCAQIVTAAESGAGGRRGALPFAARHCGHLGAIATERRLHATATPGSTPCSRSSTTTATLLGELLAELCRRPAASRPAAGYLAWIDLGDLGLGADPGRGDPRARPRRAQLRARCSGAAATGSCGSTSAPRPTSSREAVERIARGGRWLGR